MKLKFKMMIVTILSATLLMAGCGGQQTAAPKAEDYVLKVGYAGSLCEGPIHMAYEKGFFAEEGLKVELVKLAAGGPMFEAVTAGKIEAGFGLMASLIQPLSNGLPVKITTGLHTGCDKVLVPQNSGINTVADLKGKRIGVPSLTSSPVMFAKRALAAAGVGVSEKNLEVEFVVFSNSELPLALQKGAIDAIAANDPVASIAAQEYNLNILLDSAVTAPYHDQYCCVAYVKDTLAKNNPEIAAKYTRAMQKASAYVAQHPEEVAKIQVEKKYVAGNAEFNGKVLKTYNYIPSVSGAYNAFGVTAAELQNVGMLGAAADVPALHKNSFVTLPGVPDTIK
ncbi:ABC transporter substrate-binding protein [Acetonema longum]|uniref:Putative ABC transporter, substrate-binding protein n=1 Tax=Acetonema longum DSM 6540 TaxID=1009370 RepID=F7NHF9_9FIRM|nr:ABC transporter substrate-binding protein [Acetonema longum]EGO64506.1 putative ABC transporter, substrate-binding protein [Acetonema longum DSM 6540]